MRSSKDCVILKYCNAQAIEDKKPKQWSVADTIPISKSSDLSLPYIVSKTANKLILNRIQPEINKHLNKRQIKMFSKLEGQQFCTYLF